jgi:hypothetical protein
LFERLRALVSNPEAAYNALWTELDHLGMRLDTDSSNAATRHRLTKDDLEAILAKAGSMKTPSMETSQIRKSMQQTSAIGRSWRRAIGNQFIPSAVVDEVIAAVHGKQRSILVTGPAGSGKTCVMLAVQDALEKLARSSSDIVPLFIQSREFADMQTADEHDAQGLSKHWVEAIARLADQAQVVVVIDSLDVLSIARSHNVLKYFLAQTDRLLLIPNVTIVTACREFDRRYDRSIAQRDWDKEITCQPLSWELEIAPLLAKLNIDTATIEVATRTLIRNPRELALFVELAQRGGSVNAVTGQALAQQYLAAITQDASLGDAAMKAIESFATDMLSRRTLSVPKQRFAESAQMRQALLSHNILLETQHGNLAFGHQTLLDVLVVSSALRRGLSLHQFIQELTPVPFVRPSIRSFVAQLAAGDRSEFRKQVRTVLTGGLVFHIRRLVAEMVAAGIPDDQDWPLMRDLLDKHPDVFQVIYWSAVQLPWHHFWLKNLVPLLLERRDGEGITRHARVISSWQNDDAPGVIAFWRDSLKLDWADKNQIAGHLRFSLQRVDTVHCSLLAPLVMNLLELPRQKHSYFGHVLARCVTAGHISDAVLWRCIIGEVSDADVRQHRVANNLHCDSHEFDNNRGFLHHRMQQSTALLDLAVDTLERWSGVATSSWNAAAGHRTVFLPDTSYATAHSQTDDRYSDSLQQLLGTVEVAIVHHATAHSDWWQSNRARLGCSAEGALRYFAILGCVKAPTSNLDVISQMLRDKALLESDLSHEVGTLLKATFLHLEPLLQEQILAVILTCHCDNIANVEDREWIVQRQAQLILAIPVHLRTAAAQAVLDQCEKDAGPLDRKPRIDVWGGMVRSPFSFEVFLSATDDEVIRLLAHYDGHSRRDAGDFLTGGEEEVAGELRSSASRHPMRFLQLLDARFEELNARFRDSILNGAADYLAYRHGNLRPSGEWTPLEVPDATILAIRILEALESQAAYWHHRPAAASALKSCAHVVADTSTAARLISLATSFSTLPELPHANSDKHALLCSGMNMSRGRVAEALMIVAVQLETAGVNWPKALAPALLLFSADKDAAVRAMILNRLAYFQSIRLTLGWQLFDLAMENPAPGLWALAEPCLYHAYHRHFDIVGPRLHQLLQAGSAEDLETWGRISALASLAKRLELHALLTELTTLRSVDAWLGAASVWTHVDNAVQHREQCMQGLNAGLQAGDANGIAVASKCMHMFNETRPSFLPPISLLQSCADLLATAPEPNRGVGFNFHPWLNAAAQRDPEYALQATEMYLHYVRQTNTSVYDHERHLPQLMTCLFAHAEEIEEADSGAMLKRVVAAQDALLTLSVNGVNEWLSAAERP